VRQSLFFPSDPTSGKSAGGTTDSSGKFKLVTHVGGATTADGAMAGDYKVTVAKTSGAAAGPKAVTNQDLSKMSEEEKQRMMKDVQDTSGGGVKDPQADLTPKEGESLLPSKYGDVTSTTLTATVKAGAKNEFSFELKDD